MIIFIVRICGVSSSGNGFTKCSFFVINVNNPFALLSNYDAWDWYYGCLNMLFSYNHVS